MTSTTTTGLSFVQAAELLAAHLTEHALPEPVFLTVTTQWGHSELKAQLRSDTVPSLASDLLVWADTLNVVTVEAWRTPEGDRVHLSIHSTLTSPAGPVELKVFGAVDYDHHHFAGLQPDPHRGALLSPDQLRTWAANRGNR